MPAPTAQQLVEFVYEEARLLDLRRYAEWNALFTDEAIYWIPLTPNQPDGRAHSSHMHEDKLLRQLRIERLCNPRAFSQQPPSRSQHVLQAPAVEPLEPDATTFRLRTPFFYAEAQGDVMTLLVGTAHHHLVLFDGALRIAHKRVDLLNSDAALPPVQLFI